MVKQSDLRIGNWYQTDATGLTESRFTCFDNWQDAGNFLYNCSPIPLTTEILKKCGLKGPEYEFPNNSWYEINDDFEVSVNSGEYPLLKVKFLHQLQNLYFALTGEELRLLEEMGE